MSNLRVTSLRGRTAGSSPTLPDGAVVTGVTTSTSFSGNLTGNATSATTATTATNLADAANITTGTIADARFPAILPAVSGVNLTNLPASGDANDITACLFN